MYDYIKGKVTNKAASYIVVENQGIGYKISPSLMTHHEIKIDDEVIIYVHFQVKEDEQSLYGFSTQYEREVFTSILSVSGVGPKLGLKVLAEMEANKLVTTIVNEDIKTLKEIKGLGAKTAGKMILDLKNKINHLVDIKAPNLRTDNEKNPVSIYNNTFEALKNLGYKDTEIKKVLEKVFEVAPDSLEAAIKKTLKALSKV